jgi:hypothetical protein
LIRKSQVLKLSGDTFAPSRLRIPVWADCNIWRERDAVTPWPFYKVTFQVYRLVTHCTLTLHSVVLECST